MAIGCIKDPHWKHHHHRHPPPLEIDFSAFVRGAESVTNYYSELQKFFVELFQQSKDQCAYVHVELNVSS
jgi:hypothetical protein